MDLFSWPYEEGDFGEWVLAVDMLAPNKYGFLTPRCPRFWSPRSLAVPPHIWGDPAALEASHRACEEACDQMIQRLGQQGPDLKVVYLLGEVPGPLWCYLGV